MSMAECDICFNEYNGGRRRPVVGICGHTLCKQCAAKSHMNSCPMCRVHFSFFKAPTNYALMKQLEKNGELGKELDSPEDERSSEGSESSEVSEMIAILGTFLASLEDESGGRHHARLLNALMSREREESPESERLPNEPEREEMETSEETTHQPPFQSSFQGSETVRSSGNHSMALRQRTRHINYRL